MQVVQFVCEAGKNGKYPKIPGKLTFQKNYAYVSTE